MTYDLDTTLMEFGEGETLSKWTLRNAAEGVGIWGSVGSGKTTGSGRTIALKYLKHGFGGLVLTAKNDEKDQWIDYCKLAGRLEDLIIIEPNGKHKFNWLEYESRTTEAGQAITENIVEVIKTVIQAGQVKDNNGDDGSFWQDALQQVLFNIVDLCLIAYGKVTVRTMYDIALALPKMPPSSPPALEKKQKEEDHFEKAFDLAVRNI